MLEDPNTTKIESIREHTKDRLRKDGYRLLLESMETLKLTERYTTEKPHLALDFGHNYILEVRLKNDENTKIWKSLYAERSSRILIHALKVAVENEWHKKPVNRHDFTYIVSEGYSGVSRGNVNHFLNQQRARMKRKTNIFEVDDMADTVKLLYLPEEILGVEELTEKD